MKQKFKRFKITFNDGQGNIDVVTVEAEGELSARYWFHLNHSRCDIIKIEEITENAS